MLDKTILFILCECDCDGMTVVGPIVGIRIVYDLGTYRCISELGTKVYENTSELPF